MHKIILATLLSLFCSHATNGQANSEKFELDTLKKGMYTSKEIGQMSPHSASLEKLKAFVTYLEDSTAVRAKYPEKFLVLTSTENTIHAYQFIGSKAQYKRYNVDKPPMVTIYCYHTPSNLFFLRK